MIEVAEHGVLRVARWARYPWLVHGFSTRATGDFGRWPADTEVAAAFRAPGFGTATLKQVHSSACVRADRPWGSSRPEGDAVVTDRPSVLVGVRTADCVPVLLVDPVARCVAAVHAGWRGAVAGVLPGAVQRLRVQFGASPRDLEAAIGPGIGPCCFEVGEEVARRFGGDAVDREHAKPHVNLRSVLEAQLAAAGVTTVVASADCTSCRLDRYFSHRAERGVTGRMLAVAGLFPEGPGR